MSRKIMICTPMYNSQCTATYAISMINLMSALPHMQNSVEVATMFALNESLITKTRNLLTHSFLKSDCTHLLFIDSDIGFKPEQIIRLMNSDYDVICGIYPKKTINWDNVAAAVEDGFRGPILNKHAVDYLFIQDNDNAEEQSDVIEINRGGTGMMMISRKVFETLSDKVPGFVLEANLDNVFQTGDEIKEFFFTSIDEETKVYLHEDYNFCKLYKQNGGKIYAAKWVELTHSGNYIFG